MCITDKWRVWSVASLWRNKGFDLSGKSSLHITFPDRFRKWSKLSETISSSFLCFERPSRLCQMSSSRLGNLNLWLSGKMNHIWFDQDISVKWGTSSRWSFSQFCSMQNSDEMTTGKTHLTLPKFTSIKKIFRTWTEEDKEFAPQPQIADLVSSRAMRFD